MVSPDAKNSHKYSLLGVGPTLDGIGKFELLCCGGWEVGDSAFHPPRIAAVGILEGVDAAATAGRGYLLHMPGIGRMT